MVRSSAIEVRYIYKIAHFAIKSQLFFKEKIKNMKPGPKPNPTAIRVFERNPCNIPLNPNEPKPYISPYMSLIPSLNRGDCEWMNSADFNMEKVTQMIWDEFYPELRRLGVLTTVDLSLFGRYCETFARWLKMKAFIDKHGETFPVYTTTLEPIRDVKTGHLKYTPGGKVKHEPKKTLKDLKRYPQADLYLQLAGVLRRYESEFGIGAASRTRVQSIVEGGLDGLKNAGSSDDFDYASQHSKKSVK